MLTMSDDPDSTLLFQADCLKDRKWWCFLLSSIFTFLAGIFIVLIWRAFSFLCCRNRDPSEYQKQQEKDKLLAQQGQPPGQPKPKNLMEGNFVTEAKDWAGELISGQTTTGRILVSECTCVPSGAAPPGGAPWAVSARSPWSPGRGGAALVLCVYPQYLICYICVVCIYLSRMWSQVCGGG